MSSTPYLDFSFFRYLSIYLSIYLYMFFDHFEEGPILEEGEPHSDETVIQMLRGPNKESVFI